MMQQNELFRHVAYSIALIVLIDRFLCFFMKAFAFGDVTKACFIAVIAIVNLLLGLFVFRKSLGFGLTLSAIVSTRFIWYYFDFQFNEVVRFLIVVVLLVAVCFALYYLYKIRDGIRGVK